MEYIVMVICITGSRLQFANAVLFFCRLVKWSVVKTESEII